MGKAQWALFLQDSWKATRKLTLDYGLRWDFATASREQYGRSAGLLARYGALERARKQTS